MSCMMLSGLPRLVGALLHPLLHPFLHPLLLPLLLSSFKIPGGHSSLHARHPLATSHGRPESIMQDMMLSGPLRILVARRWQTCSEECLPWILKEERRSGRRSG